MEKVMALDTEHHGLTLQGDHVLLPSLFAYEILHFPDVMHLEIATVFTAVLAGIGCQSIN
jgi:hypothetical protein